MSRFTEPLPRYFVLGFTGINVSPSWWIWRLLRRSKYHA